MRSLGCFFKGERGKHQKRRALQASGFRGPSEQKELLGATGPSDSAIPVASHRDRASDKIDRAKPQNRLDPKRSDQLGKAIRQLAWRQREQK